MSKIKIAGLQLNIEWENRTANYKRVTEFAAKAKEEGVQLLILPEMFSTGFSMNPSYTAENRNGETFSFIKALAKELMINVIAGYVVKAEDNRGINTAIAINKNGKELCSYAKTHLFSFMGEHNIHVPGDGPELFKIEGLNATCFICYDLRFPELFRLIADRADVVFVIASWPKVRQKHWDIMLRSRAIENQLYVIGVNRVGNGGGLEFGGATVIIDPQGNVLANGCDKEGLVIAKIDSDVVLQTRKSMPFLKDIKFTI